MKKLALAFIIVVVLPAIILLFLTLKSPACSDSNCVFCIWEELLNALEAYDRLMAFWFICPFLPISFVAHAQGYAHYGIDLIMLFLSGVYDAGYNAGVRAGGSS